MQAANASRENGRASQLMEDDSDDDFVYEEVEVDVDDEDLEDEEDLETALIKVRQQAQVGEVSHPSDCIPLSKQIIFCL